MYSSNFFTGTPFLALWLYDCFTPVMMIQTIFVVNYFYNFWRHCENGVHLGIYFNMMVQKLAYINGSNKNQLQILGLKTVM